MFAERYDLSKVIFKQKARGNRDDFCQSILAATFTPRQTDVKLLRLFSLRCDDQLCLCRGCLKAECLLAM